MSLIEFPYAFHKQYLMPIVPLLIEGHKVWAYVDSGATFSILSVDDARRIGLAWQTGRRQMIVVGDGSFIPTYLFDLRLQIGAQAESARRMPAREAAYRNLVLNQRINMHSPFIARAVWESCGGGVDEDVFRGRPVYAGLELSARNDLTALVLVAQDDAGTWHVRPEFWCPEAGLEERARRDRAPYDVWAKAGHLRATPGASVDFSFVAQFLAELGSEMELRCVGFDRWRMDYLTAEMSRLGLPYSVLQKVELPEGGLPDGLALPGQAQGCSKKAGHSAGS